MSTDEDLMPIVQILALREKTLFTDWTLGEVNMVTKTALAAHELKERVEKLEAQLETVTELNKFLEPDNYAIEATE